MLFHRSAFLSLAVALMTIGTAYSSRAAAQPEAADKAKIIALFDEAKQLMARGDYVAACSKLEEGERLDETALGLMMKLGECYEKAKQFTKAWEQYSQTAVAAERAGDRRQAEAVHRADTLKAKLSRISVDIAEASRTSGLLVQLNGIPMSPEQWGQPVTMDPGSYTIEVSAPGKVRWSSRVTVVEAELRIIAVPALADEPVEKPIAPVLESPDRKAAASASSKSIALPAVSIGVGAVALGAGAYFLVQMARDISKSNQFCDSSNYCDPEGVALRDEAKTERLAGVIATGAGMIAATTGIVLLRIQPSKVESALVLGPSSVAYSRKF